MGFIIRFHHWHWGNQHILVFLSDKNMLIAWVPVMQLLFIDVKFKTPVPFQYWQMIWNRGVCGCVYVCICGTEVMTIVHYNNTSKHEVQKHWLHWCYMSIMASHLQQLDCLFNHSLRLTTEKTCLCIAGPFWRKFTGKMWIPFTRASNVEYVHML